MTTFWAGLRVLGEIFPSKQRSLKSEQRQMITNDDNDRLWRPGEWSRVTKEKPIRRAVPGYPPFLSISRVVFHQLSSPHRVRELGGCFTNISGHKRTKSASGKTGTPPENGRERNQEGFREGLTSRKTRKDSGKDS
jgi:hypothetical protein